MDLFLLIWWTETVEVSIILAQIYTPGPGGLEDLKGLFLLRWEDLKELSRTDSIRLYFNSIRLNLNFYRILIVLMLNRRLHKSDFYTFYGYKYSLSLQ